MSCAEPGSRGLALSAHVVVERSAFSLDVELAVRPATTTALIGPNGAGKSTLVAALAGLVPPSAGRIVLGDRTLDDPAGGVHVEVGRRGVVVAFQDTLLFDGLSVLDNVAFGRRAAGERKAAARRHAHDLLAELGLGDRASDRPRSLSGGLAARVALARALAVEPELLLLDEPFSALDATARDELRPWLAALLAARSVTTVLVTHDPRDAAMLAASVVVVEGGRVTDTCAPADLHRSPSAYAAAFLP